MNVSRIYALFGHGRPQATVLAATLAMLAVTASASPPPWAPAHGWRAKNDHGYTGYSGYSWERDYGVVGGHCNTDEVLAAVGAVTGGVIGNRTASPDHRTVATIVGAIIGGVVGAKIGDAIDDHDRACIGHSLELVPPDQTVTWTNPSSGYSYNLRPLRDLDERCREFELRAADKKGKKGKQRLRACRDDGGEWRAMPGR
jgi:surface antigen